MSDIEVKSESGDAYLLRPDGTWVRREAIRVVEGGFRKVTWGSSADTIRQIETADFEQVSSENNLLYTTKIGERSYGILYILVGDVLVRAKYILMDEYVNELNFIAAADELRAFVVSKYGSPSDHKEYWSGDLYRDNPLEKGRAVETGELAIFTTWSTEDAVITLAVTGENFETSVSLEYMSREYSEFEDRHRQDSILDNF